MSCTPHGGVKRLRIRALKPGFFKNEQLAELSPWHRLCFEGLWLCADREGRLQDRPKRLKAEMFPYDDLDVNQLLWDLMRAGFIVRYQVNGHPYITIPSWEQHQHPRADEADSTFPPYEAGTERADSDPTTFPAARPLQLIDKAGIAVIDATRNAGVYFIGSGAHVKIGFSSSCEDRIKRLLRGAPRTKLLGVMWTTSGEEAERKERELHERFTSSRINHEWFRLTDDVKAFIDGLRDDKLAGDETATLPSLSSDAAVTGLRIGQVDLGQVDLGSGTSGEAPEPPARVAFRAQDLMELWNAVTHPPIPRCQELTDERRRKIRARAAKRPSLADWREAFEAIDTSAFHRGENDRGWVANFDWIVRNDTKVTEVLERARTVSTRPAARLGKQSTTLLSAVAGLADERV